MALLFVVDLAMTVQYPTIVGLISQLIFKFASYMFVYEVGYLHSRISLMWCMHCGPLGARSSDNALVHDGLEVRCSTPCKMHLRGPTQN